MLFKKVVINSGFEERREFLKKDKCLLRKTRVSLGKPVFIKKLVSEEHVFLIKRCF